MIDLERIQRMCSLDKRFWSEIHTEGKVRTQLEG